MKINLNPKVKQTEDTDKDNELEPEVYAVDDEDTQQLHITEGYDFYDTQHGDSYEDLSGEWFNA